MDSLDIFERCALVRFSRAENALLAHSRFERRHCCGCYVSEADKVDITIPINAEQASQLVMGVSCQKLLPATITIGDS